MYHCQIAEKTEGLLKIHIQLKIKYHRIKHLIHTQGDAEVFEQRLINFRKGKTLRVIDNIALVLRVCFKHEEIFNMLHILVCQDA